MPCLASQEAAPVDIAEQRPGREGGDVHTIGGERLASFQPCHSQRICSSRVQPRCDSVTATLIP
jgi:hypothetical protein